MHRIRVAVLRRGAVVSARAAFIATTFLGTFWTVYGLYTSLTDVGVGVAVASAGVIGYGYCEYQR